MAGELPPTKQERALKEREESLFSRWRKGLVLTTGQLAEIQHLLPVMSEPEVAGVDDLVAPPLLRTSAATSPVRHRYQKNLRDYVVVYDTKLRAIKRWIAIGKAAGVLPPLDDPPAMAAWWEEYMTQRVPAKILALAAGIVPSRSENSAGEVGPGESVNVDEIDVDGLDSLRQAKRYLSAIDRKLSAAYVTGNEAEIRRWQKPFNEAQESVRKLEASRRDALKAAGDMLPRSEFLAEFSQLLNLLRQMQASTKKRVLSRLADLPAELLERIGAAIETERAGELTILQQLKGFQSVDEAIFQLEAAT